MSAEDEMGTSLVDVRVSAIAAMLEPGLTLARIARVPLDDLRELVSTGYFRSMRDRGYSWTKVADRMRKSRRTVAQLAKTAGEDDTLVITDVLRLQRHLVRLAAAQTAVTDLPERLPEYESVAVERELQALNDQGVVQVEDGNVVLGRGFVDMVGDGWDKKLASLRHFAESVGQTVYRRFFQPGASDTAMARVLSFSVAADEFESLMADIYALIEDRVVEADARAGEGGVSASLVFSAVRTPTDVHWR